MLPLHDAKYAITNYSFKKSLDKDVNGFTRNINTKIQEVWKNQTYTIISIPITMNSPVTILSADDYKCIVIGKVIELLLASNYKVELNGTNMTISWEHQFQSHDANKYKELIKQYTITLKK